jgi:ataxin-3
MWLTDYCYSIQLAFVLNLEQHWLTLRRFGNLSANIEADEGNGHWFNLNSFLDTPQWVSKTYLGMVLQQMEEEGTICNPICY